MKVKITQKKVESSHVYIEKGKPAYALIVGKKDDVLDSEEAEYGDAERALRYLVSLGYAVEV